MSLPPTGPRSGEHGRAVKGSQNSSSESEFIYISLPFFQPRDIRSLSLSIKVDYIILLDCWKINNMNYAKQVVQYLEQDI